MNVIRQTAFLYCLKTSVQDKLKTQNVFVAVLEFWFLIYVMHIFMFAYDESINIIFHILSTYEKRNTNRVT